MEATTINKHAVRLTRRYPAAPERVFDALVNPSSLAKWFAPNDEMSVDAEFDPVPGGRYRVEMHHMLGNVYTVNGVYETVDAPNKLVFTWQWEDEPMSEIGESRVTFLLKPIDGGTELTLVHDGFPVKEAADNHNKGWSGCLWRMERLFGDSALATFSNILAINRKLYNNALDGVAKDDLLKRPSDDANHMLWIAGHLAHNRATMANLLGSDIESPLAVFNEALDVGAAYPGLDEVLEFHTVATHALLDQIPLADEALLTGPAPFEFPINDKTMLGTLGFFAQHEAYHVGQLGLLRRQLGHPATSYADVVK